MSNILNIDKLSHRSKERIKDLGEVFTPEIYVEEMLDLLSKDNKKIWSDENIIFFEPTAGHGNIVLPIYRRRLEGIYKKGITLGLSRKNDESSYYAVANALNTLWAIDIDTKNVENCRSRVLSTTLEFLKSKLSIKSDLVLLSKKRDFFAHVIAAIKWHISENETLSALSNSENAKASAHLTKAGAKWFSKNGHNELDFDLSWVNFFEACENSNTIPLEYERAIRFIDNILAGKTKGFDDFEFAKVVINTEKIQDAARKSSRSMAIGV